MKSWIKLYTEILEDPEQGTLSITERGLWCLMLALAGRIDDRDDDRQSTGRIDTPEHVAWHLRCDTDTIEAALPAFERRGMIEMIEGVIYLPNFQKRQERKPSDAPERVAERVTRHRERVTPCNALKRDVTRLETDPDSETEERQPARVAPPEPQASPEPVPSSSSSLIQPWSRVLSRAGILVGSQLESEKWADLADEAGPERFQSAVQVAVEQNKRSLAYVRGVVRHSMAEGKMPGAPPTVRAPDPPPKPKVRKPIKLMNGNNEEIEAFVYVEDSR